MNWLDYFTLHVSLSIQIADTRVRNALARAVRYLNVDYPLQNVPSDEPITRVGYFGHTRGKTRLP
jgi:hypothetical protein